PLLPVGRLAGFDLRQRSRGGFADVRVFVIEQGLERRQRRLGVRADLAEGLGGAGAHFGLGVLQGADQCGDGGGRGRPDLPEGGRGRAADFGLFVLQRLGQGGDGGLGGRAELPQRLRGAGADVGL